MLPNVSAGSLLGRQAIVTGAGRGIGRACALELAAMGATVALVARTESELARVMDEIAARGGLAFPISADVTIEDDVALVFGQLHKDLPLWACVNCAGTNRPGGTLDYDVADYDYLMAANVRSTFLMSRAVGRLMVQQGHGGRLINISSQMGLVGYPGRAVYCAAKHAVNGLTKALGVEWAHYGITVNAVAPTFVETALTEPMLKNSEFREEVLRRIPLGRLGRAEEVAAAVGFLASPNSSLITGHVLAVDGGWVAW